MDYGVIAFAYAVGCVLAAWGLLLIEPKGSWALHVGRVMLWPFYLLKFIMRAGWAAVAELIELQ